MFDDNFHAAPIQKQRSAGGLPGAEAEAASEMATAHEVNPFRMVAEEGAAEVAVETKSEPHNSRFVAGSALQRIRSSCRRTRSTVRRGNYPSPCNSLSKRNLERMVTDHRRADHPCACCSCDREERRASCRTPALVVERITVSVAPAPAVVWRLQGQGRGAPFGV